MKAWVLRNINDIRYEDVEVPLLKENEALVHVKAAGICGSDIPRIFKIGAHRMPLIPGHEFAGVVEGIGRDVDSYWMGRRVSVYPLIACGVCKPCLSGHMEMCRDYDYIGSRRDGAFAEYVSVPVSNLIEIPDEVSYEAAAMFEPMAVAVHAMMKGLGDVRSRLPVDTAVAVCGLGSVGMLIISFLKSAGYEKIYAIGKRAGQKDRVEKAGLPADQYCDSTRMDPAGYLADSTGGVGVYFECTGRNDSFKTGVSCTAPGGRIVVVGNPYGDMTLPGDVYWKILRNQLTVMGTWNSSFYGARPLCKDVQNLAGEKSDLLNKGYTGGCHEGYQDDWNYVLKRLTDAKSGASIDRILNNPIPSSLITHMFPLNKLDRALRLMRDKTEDYCKVMITNEGDAT